MYTITHTSRGAIVQYPQTYTNPSTHTYTPQGVPTYIRSNIHLKGNPQYLHTYTVTHTSRGNPVPTYIHSNTHLKREPSTHIHTQQHTPQGVPSTHIHTQQHTPQGGLSTHIHTQQHTPQEGPTYIHSNTHLKRDPHTYTTTHTSRGTHSNTHLKGDPRTHIHLRHQGDDTKEIAHLNELAHYVRGMERFHIYEGTGKQRTVIVL